MDSILYKLDKYLSKTFRNNIYYPRLEYYTNRLNEQIGGNISELLNIDDAVNIICHTDIQNIIAIIGEDEFNSFVKIGVDKIYQSGDVVLGDVEYTSTDGNIQGFLKMERLDKNRPTIETILSVLIKKAIVLTNDNTLSLHFIKLYDYFITKYNPVTHVTSNILYECKIYESLDYTLADKLNLLKKRRDISKYIKYLLTTMLQILLIYKHIIAIIPEYIHSDLSLNNVMCKYEPGIDVYIHSYRDTKIIINASDIEHDRIIFIDHGQYDHHFYKCVFRTEEIETGSIEKDIISLCQYMFFSKYSIFLLYSNRANYNQKQINHMNKYFQSMHDIMTFLCNESIDSNIINEYTALHQKSIDHHKYVSEFAIIDDKHPTSITHLEFEKLFIKLHNTTKFGTGSDLFRYIIDLLVTTTRDIETY